MNDVDAKRLGARPTAAGGLLGFAYARARRAGIELMQLLKKAGLTDHQVKDRRARLPVQHQIQFLNLVAAALHGLSRGLGFATATTSAAFFPHLEQRIRCASVFASAELVSKERQVDHCVTRRLNRAVAALAYVDQLMR